jgi:hypothetical protein
MSEPETLGDHLKTGHTGSPQNRPMELRQDKLIYTLSGRSLAMDFHGSDQLDIYSRIPGRKTGLRRDATRAPTQGPEWRGDFRVARHALKSHSGATAINPGSARAAPSQ